MTVQRHDVIRLPSSAARMLALVLLAVLARPARNAHAQGSGDQGAVVRGTVYDSLAGSPVIGAIVQFALVRDSATIRSFSATSNASGRFEIGGLPQGQYLATFAHRSLDSLGLEAPMIALTVSAGGREVDLATPSARTIMTAVCDTPGLAERGLLIGHVRRSDGGTALPDATVRVEWRELADSGPPRLMDRAVDARTDQQGWFGLCGVAADLPVLVQVHYGADSSGVVATRMSSQGLAHLTFFVGEWGESAAGGAARDEKRPGRWQRHGRVVDQTGAPVANASVSAWGTNEDVVSDAVGRFTLRKLPGGTRTIEARAVGYAPSQQVMHVLPGEAPTIEVRLERLAVELPAVDVRARWDEERVVEFDRRRRLGLTATFLSPEDLAARPEATPDQLLHTVPGVLVRQLRGRSEAMMLVPPTQISISGRTECTPTLYVDGQRHAFTYQEFRDSFKARDLLAIEVYPRPTSRPAEFIDFQNHCGAIVVWTRRGSRR